jgi:hypothetical protein
MILMREPVDADRTGILSAGLSQMRASTEVIGLTGVWKNRYLLPGVLVAVLLSGLALAIPPRNPPSSDTDQYVSMLEGRFDLANAPQRYRVVVPFLARLLPLPPLSALRLITVVSLLLAYLVCFAECSLLNIGAAATSISVVAMFCSRPILFNYFNPFLTDGLGLLVLFVLSVLFLCDRFAPFAALLILGVFVRESAMFVLPAWVLTARWRKALLLGLLATALFLAPRIAFPSHINYATYVSFGLRSKLNLRWALPCAKEVLLSWQGMWLLAGYGLLHSPRRIRLLAAALAVGSFASFLVTTGEWERMLMVMAPVVAAMAAVAIERALKVNRWTVVFFVATLPAQFLFGNPYVLQSVALQNYRILLVLTLTLSVIASTLVLGAATGTRKQKMENRK